MKPNESRRRAFVWFAWSGADDAAAEALLVAVDGDRLAGSHGRHALVEDDARRTIPHLDMHLDEWAGMSRAHQIAPGCGHTTRNPA